MNFLSIPKKPYSSLPGSRLNVPPSTTLARNEVRTSPGSAANPQQHEKNKSYSLFFFLFSGGGEEGIEERGDFLLFICFPSPSPSPRPQYRTHPRGVWAGRAGGGGRGGDAVGGDAAHRPRGAAERGDGGARGAGPEGSGRPRPPPPGCSGPRESPEPGRFPYPGIAGHLAIGPFCHMDSNFVHLTVSRRVSRNRKTSKGGDRNKF